MPTTLPALIAALQDLDRLDPIERARRAPLLIDVAKGVLAAVRADSFREASATGLSLAEIGRRVGTSRAKVSEAIKAYGTGHRPAPPASTQTAPTVDQGHARPTPQHADGDSEITPPEEQHQPEAEAQQADRPTGRLRSESRLGPDWATDDNDVLWWRRDTRAGSVSPAWPGSGWTARTAQHTPITTSPGKRGAYPSRIKALTAVAADFETRRRARTAHADVALDGAPGWRLTQTQADHDRHRWNVVTPTGDVAGTVTKVSWHHQAWEATAGDPAKRHHDPLPIEPIGDEPGRSSADGYWRTRTAAALAVARWHDPDLDPAPAVRQLAGGLDGGGPPR
ncbi:hypothetical protein [Nonomuraea sp. NPDC050202]|uniref:hypothetical protein n=1 Tax=Nonomuraea sp. NPDC050202 TaxID=3155035 RepID=UPI0033F62BBB